MKLPTWIPRVARPHHKEWGETWDAMDDNERRVSFLIDVLACVAFLCFLAVCLS